MSDSSGVTEPTGFLESVRKAVALAVMLSGAILTALIFTALAPVLPEIGHHYAERGGAMVAQFIGSAPGLGVIVGGLTGGFVVDRFGRKRMLMLALAVFAISGSAVLYLESPWALLASRAILGWSGATAQAAVIGMIGTLFAEPRRSRLIGFEAAIGTFAAILSFGISGQVAETFGWRAPGALYLFGLVLLVAGWLAIPKSMNYPRPADASDPVVPGGAYAAFVKRMWIFYLLIPLFYTCNYLLSTQMAFLLGEIGVVGPAAKSKILMIGVIFGVPGAALAGYLRGWIGEARQFALLTLLMGTGFAVISLATAPPIAMLGGAIAGFGSGMLMPTIMAMALSRAADTLRSRAAGLVYALAYVGEFLNPAVFGTLALSFGIHGAFRSAAIWLVSVSILVFLISRAGWFTRLTGAQGPAAKAPAAVH